MNRSNQAQAQGQQQQHCKEHSQVQVVKQQQQKSKFQIPENLFEMAEVICRNFAILIAVINACSVK